jgi:hypothetical protein
MRKFDKEKKVSGVIRREELFKATVGLYDEKSNREPSLVIDKQKTLLFPINDKRTDTVIRKLYEKQEELMLYKFLSVPISEWNEE